MYDSFEPFHKLLMQSFAFLPSRYEIWKAGKIISQGETTEPIIARVVVIDGIDRMEISFNDMALVLELAPQNIFDEFITSKDRLQLITVPSRTNSENIGINGFKMILGPTREAKDFNYNEPYCCNLFLQENRIVKMTYSFSKPEKLLEFYQDNKIEKMWNFEFVSSDHVRYENNRHVSGPHGGAKRLIKVEPNINGGEGYSISIYNLEGIHPVWQNNIQMAHKQMKTTFESQEKIILLGYGYDPMGAAFSDYGLTIKLKDGKILSCILHMHDRNVDIEYLP